MKRNVCLIGHLGENGTYLDGQTVKTKTIYQALRDATDWNIRCVDTSLRRRRPLRLLWRTLRELLRCKDVFVLLSTNGVRFYFPLLYLFAKVRGTRVYHDVIGGWLPDLVTAYPRFQKYVAAFRVNWVETQQLCDRLRSTGLENIRLLPNFKQLTPVSAEHWQPWREKPYRFCTFSRVMLEKGIEDAIDAVEQINAQAGETLCTLDIYGAVDEGYRERFEQRMARVSDAVRYGGGIPFDRSTEVIGGCYALLFPTHFTSEGVPGTVVDAFFSGVPVIAADISCNAELIAHGKNGLLYPSAEATDLVSAMRFLLDRPELAFAMKAECLRAAERYRPESNLPTVISLVESEASA